MNRRILIGCGIGLLLLLCFVLIGIVLIFVAIRSDEPENVQIDLNAPISVPAGEPFAVEIEVTNLLTETQVLDSIDLSLDYLEFISVVEVRPSAVDSFEVPVVRFYSYTFEEEIDTSEHVTVVFEMVGETEGEYSGTIDVCINDGGSCQSLDVETTIGTTPGR